MFSWANDLGWSIDIKSLKSFSFQLDEQNKSWTELFKHFTNVKESWLALKPVLPESLKKRIHILENPKDVQQISHETKKDLN